MHFDTTTPTGQTETSAEESGNFMTEELIPPPPPTTNTHQHTPPCAAEEISSGIIKGGFETTGEELLSCPCCNLVVGLLGCERHTGDKYRNNTG